MNRRWYQAVSLRKGAPMVDPIPLRKERPQDREEIVAALEELLARLDKLGLFQAGAHLSMAIESLNRGRLQGR